MTKWKSKIGVVSVVQGSTESELEESEGSHLLTTPLMTASVLIQWQPDRRSRRHRRKNQSITMLVLRASECSPNHMLASCLHKKVAQVVRRFPLLYDKCYKDFNETNKKKNAREDEPKQNGHSSGTLNCRSERTPKVQEISHLLGVDPFLFLFGLGLGRKMKAWFFG